MSASDDNEGLREAIHCSFTSAKTTACYGHHKNVAALRIGLKESDMLEW